MTIAAKIVRIMLSILGELASSDIRKMNVRKQNVSFLLRL
jgi:hypothetical protein